jgi:hypothetical protein
LSLLDSLFRGEALEAKYQVKAYQSKKNEEKEEATD